jgi:DnaJ-class molecular chaperone
MAEDVKLNMFQAAVKLRMSPNLLKWFTTYPAKKNTKRLLPVAKNQGKTFFFSESELEAFDKYLKEPWPSEPGERPHIPAGIQDEIKTETFLQCAVCHSNADSCEIAHIQPVATSKCNHPHNLIFLCANHHTKFDKTGVLGPRKEVTDLVEHIKSTLLLYKMVVWEVHADTLVHAFSLVQLCARLKSDLASLNTPKEVGFYSKMAGEVIKSLENTAFSSKNKRDRRDTNSENLWAKLEATSSKHTLAAQLEYAADLSEDEDLRVAAGFVKCPLCMGEGVYESSECPVCLGERLVEKQFVTVVDIDSYRMVNCSLCKGNGNYEGENCPACHGDKQIQQRYAERIDLREYEHVDCPLCDGQGCRDGEDCPVCNGDRTLQRRFVASLDISSYNIINCPICDGNGQVGDGYVCRACMGEGKMTKGRADNLDLGDFELCRCKLCKGKGLFLQGECPACAGEGQLQKGISDQMDWRGFELVKCPTCNGRGYRGDYDCSSCGGDGTMLSRDVERLY